MDDNIAARMNETLAAHNRADALGIEALRRLSLPQRGQLIEPACAAAAAIRQGRLASGLGDIEPAPWPASTWQFQKEQAAQARSQIQPGD